MEVALSCGWLIWTPMKMAPAAAAAMPAQRVSLFGVMVMSGSLFGSPRRVPRGYLEPRSGRGPAASPHDVIHDVTSGPSQGSQNAVLVGSAYGGSPRLDVELGEDALGVATQGVQRDVELVGDLRPGQLGVQQSEDLDLAPAQ